MRKSDVCQILWGALPPTTLQNNELAGFLYGSRNSSLGIGLYHPLLSLASEVKAITLLPSYQPTDFRYDFFSNKFRNVKPHKCLQ